jgi:SAM-dependent methyltransferase
VGPTRAQPKPFHCPACRRDLEAFAPGPGGRLGAKCPHCKALARYRFLAYLFNRLAPVIATSRLVLDIAPQTAVQALLRDLAGADRYLALDLSPHRQVDALASLERLPLPDRVVDFAVCYHVLEHVVDDSAAIAELGRVLAPGGLLVLQVPIKRGRPTEHDPHAAPERLLERFGHSDHRRLYGDDFEALLRKGGLEATLTRPRDYVTPEETRRLGLNNQPVWLCRVATTQLPPLPGQLGPDVLRLHRHSEADAGAPRPLDRPAQSGGTSRASARRRVRAAVARVPGARPAYRALRRLVAALRGGKGA